MVGEEAEFDVFISYRVGSDFHHAETLYNMLTSEGIRVWWDKACLELGKPWDEGFCDGLCKSTVFVPIISGGAINHPTLVKQNITLLTETSTVDNVLLEYRLALELQNRRLIELICPVMVGNLVGNNEDAIYTNYYASGCHPNTSKVFEVVVEQLESRLTAELDRQSLGSPLSDRLGVGRILDLILKNQGCFVEGSKSNAFSTTIGKIKELVLKNKKNNIQKKLILNDVKLVSATNFKSSPTRFIPTPNDIITSVESNSSNNAKNNTDDKMKVNRKLLKRNT